VAQTADNSLEGRIAALEQWQRASQNTNAVVGSAVAAVNTGQVSLTGVANAGVGSVGWDLASGPSVDLFVSGGRVRVDLAARLEVHGNKTSVYAGYQVRGPVADPAVTDLGTAPVVLAPDVARAIEFQDPDGTGMSRLGGFGVHDIATALAVGWYRFTMVYFLAYGGTTTAPYGNITNRRLTVTRY
jgi:hypothetical protein